MKIMITTTTKDTHKRLSTNSENGSFQNRPQVILSSSFPDATIRVIKRQ